jgi:hypothetical protein
MRELEIRVAATDTTPDWFVGRNGFEVALFTTAVRGMTTTPTAPASSSSWSGSGGGSSLGRALSALKGWLQTGHCTIQPATFGRSTTTTATWP